MKEKSNNRDEAVRKMIDETEVCLNCGKKLKYLPKKDQRRNRGYCSLKCYLEKPPKLAYIEYEFKKPAKAVLIRHLNTIPTVECVAGLLGVNKQQLYIWIKKYGIKKKVIWG